jgi:hypothetical protein
VCVYMFFIPPVNQLDKIRRTSNESAFM